MTVQKTFYCFCPLPGWKQGDVWAACDMPYRFHELLCAHTCTHTQTHTYLHKAVRQNLCHADKESHHPVSKGLLLIRGNKLDGSYYENAAKNHFRTRLVACYTHYPTEILNTGCDYKKNNFTIHCSLALLSIYQKRLFALLYVHKVILFLMQKNQCQYILFK